MRESIRRFFRRDPAAASHPEPQPGAAMVREQIFARGIKDERVLAVMARLDRRLFVDPSLADHAFDDAPLPTRDGQTISQPYIVAAMTEALEVGATHRILEIGTGTGYQTAILAELGGEVVTVERDPVLAGEAQERLHRLGYDRVHCIAGDGFHGWPARAPYDRSLGTAAPARLSPRLLAQLVPGGITVAPEGRTHEQDSPWASQILRRWRRTGDTFAIEDLMDVRFVPLLPGPEA
jgi:protein-L-isoaspartate(D-aspartate) O-methyltransferase